MGIAAWIEGIMGKKGIEQGNSDAGGGDDTAALLGGKEKPGKALVVPLSHLVLQCRPGMGSPWGTLQGTL